QPIARGLRGALRRRLDSYHRDEWSTAAAALLAIADPDRAFASSLHLGLKKRELTPADVESEFGADLYDAERHAICEAYTEPLHNQTLDTRGHSLLGRFAPTLPDSTELRVTCRGAGGTLVTIDLSVFDEPLDTEDGRLQCPYEAADILELLRVTGRLVTPPGGADEEHAVRRARQVARLRTAGTRIRTVPLAGRSN
ncbi:MAG: hypothetical protein FJ104_17185, partial [Deltaproteobacteria bacterium]|nr:hypothetical protein [Deltaproteobacteria bacterium]